MRNGVGGCCASLLGMTLRGWLRPPEIRPRPAKQSLGEVWIPIPRTQRKCFWLLLTILSLGAIFLPFGWGVVETLASVIISWWVVYRSGIL